MHELQAKQLVKHYGDRRVVDGVSFSVKSGQIVGLLGPNGAGKTTSFYMVVGLLRPDAGAVWLDSEEMTALPMYQRARKGIGYLPQEASVFRKLTVEDNLRAVLEGSTVVEERDEIIEDLLKSFHLDHLRSHQAFSLSGGERRRVEIARALALKPAFILLDEPFAGIDPIAVIDLQKIIADMRARGIGILITDHNVRETLVICDYACLLNDGKIQEVGTPEELAQSTRARKTYLGEGFRL